MNSKVYLALLIIVLICVSFVSTQSDESESEYELDAVPRIPPPKPKLPNPLGNIRTPKKGMEEIWKKLGGEVELDEADENEYNEVEDQSSNGDDNNSSPSAKTGSVTAKINRRSGGSSGFGGPKAGIVRRIKMGSQSGSPISGRFIKPSNPNNGGFKKRSAPQQQPADNNNDQAQDQASEIELDDANIGQIVKNSGMGKPITLGSAAREAFADAQNSFKKRIYTTTRREDSLDEGELDETNGPQTPRKAFQHHKNSKQHISVNVNVQA